MSKLIDETGHKYGSLTVIKYMGIIDNSNQGKWLCKCDCGNTIYVAGCYLRNGAYTSCGCRINQIREHEDITGKRFGKLIATKYIDSQKGWQCKCDCGRICYKSITVLKNGKAKDCGCSHNYKYINEKKDKRFKRLHTIYRNIIQRCYNKNKDTYKYYGEKGIKLCDEWLGENGFKNFYYWAINNGYVNIEGKATEKLSIDRIDSNKDYSPENCRWITLEENIIRSGISTYKLETKIKELNNESTDELVQNYIKRKIELKEQNLLKEEPRTPKGNFFYRKPNYCYLHNTDNTKQFIFRNYKNVALFLEISISSVGYRVRKKDGIVADGWKLEKIDKEQYDFYLKKGIELIR